MIILSADHGGWKLKQKLVTWLERQGESVVNLQPRSPKSTDDYPVAAAALAQAVRQHRGAKGIAVCRSGVGMALVSNKFSGIRAAQAFTVRMAKKSRQDEDSNILSLAADYHSWPEIQRMVAAWLATPYRPIKRFERRLRQLKAIERHAR